MLTRVLALSCFAAFLGFASGQSGSLPAVITDYSYCNGDWEVAHDMHKVLGYDNPDRDGVTFPSSFSLTVEANLDKGADPTGVHKSLVDKMGHVLHASGRWIADENEMGFKTDRCLVSIFGGRTFIWFTDVPFTMIHGGAVSYIEGVDSNNDLLVVDFNTMPKHLAGHMRGQETIVYRRKKH